MNLNDFEEMFNQGTFNFRNKTKEYLAAVMAEHGTEFRDKIRSLDNTGIFVDDVLARIDDASYCLFFLFNVHRSYSKGVTDFNAMITEFKGLSFYVADYPFGELLGGKLHAVVFRIPDKYQFAYNTFTAFKANKTAPVYYSKMYSKAEIEKLFVALYGPNTKAVRTMLKDPKRRAEFEEEINRYGAYATEYNNVPWIELKEENELEYIPNPREEILNYKKPEED